MEKNDYKANLKIDKNNIDSEILMQAQLYYEWSYLAAEAENQRDQEKETLEIITTMVENRFRTEPEKYFDLNGKPPTEGAIKAKINNDVAVRTQRRKLLEATAKFRLLKKAELAFEQRKDMIQSHLRYIEKIKHSEVIVPKTELEETGRKIRKQLQKRGI